MSLAYAFGGIELRSTTPFPELRPIAGAAAPRLPRVEFSISEGREPRPERLLFEWPGRYGLSLSTCADGWLFSSPALGAVVVATDGGKVSCCPKPGAPPSGF